jgi:hypothetical protein
MSPRSNGLTKSPSGLRASSRSSASLRACSGSFLRVVAALAEDVEGAELDLLVML